jgi:hypothetical protein
MQEIGTHHPGDRTARLLVVTVGFALGRRDGFYEKAILKMYFPPVVTVWAGKVERWRETANGAGLKDNPVLEKWSGKI